MQHTFNFTIPGNYTYDAALIEFAAGLAKLLDLRPAGATFYAGFGTDENADWSNGVAAGTFRGAASVAGGILDCSGNGDACTWGGALNVGADPNVGCIRFRFRVGDPTPAGNSALMVIATAWNNANNSLGVYLRPTGQLYLQYKDSTGAGTNINMGAWAGVADTWYEGELNWDLSDVTGKRITFLIDGVVFYQSGVNRARTNTIDWMAAAVSVNHIWDQYNNKYDDILIFDTFQHKANYTPDWSGISPTIYTLTDPTVQTQTFLMGCLNSITETATKPGSDDVRYQFVFGGVPYWCNGAAWVVSDGSYAQANDAAHFTPDACACMCQQIGEGWYALNAVLHSADGSTTPSLDKVILDYDECPAPPEPEPPIPEPDQPDYLTESSNSRRRGPRGNMRGRPWYRYYGPGRRGDG